MELDGPLGHGAITETTMQLLVQILVRRLTCAQGAVCEIEVHIEGEVVTSVMLCEMAESPHRVLHGK